MIIKSFRCKINNTLSKLLVSFLNTNDIIPLQKICRLFLFFLNGSEVISLCSRTDLDCCRQSHPNGAVRAVADSFFKVICDFFLSEKKFEASQAG